MRSHSGIVSLLTIIFMCYGGCYGRECYSCRYSSNRGCDLTIDQDKISSTVSCNNDCYTQITRSSSGNDFDVIRGCYSSPVCYDTSYSVGDQAYIVSCCDGDKCNDDASKEVFECMQCSDEDGKASSCPDSTFWDSDKTSLDTVYCSKFCEKEVRDEDGTVIVTRSCVDSCEEESYSAFGITTNTYCCNDIDACNTASVPRGGVVIAFLLACLMVFL